MKSSFRDFIEQSPNCYKFDGVADAILVFEYLSKDESIIQMIEACDNGKPALMPVARGIEDIS